MNYERTDCELGIPSLLGIITEKEDKMTDEEIKIFQGKRQETKNDTNIFKTIDFTTAKPNFSTSFDYNRDFEMPIACYALTKMVQDHAKYTGDIKKYTDQPSTITIFTNLNEKTKVFCDIIAVFEKGSIAGVFIANIDKYIVEIMAQSKEDLREIETLYSKYISRSNFYRSKCLKLTRENGLSFVSKPDKTLSDIVLPEKLIKEFVLNVIEFLQNEKLHSIFKKRSIILHGPPGVGKTSLISAAFTELLQHDVTCVFMSDDVFKRFSLDWIMTLINKFLTPVCLVFEDIDLIGYDRTTSKSSVIGPLLSMLDGIESFPRPIVIIATTNRFEVLDEALTRPVRFDRRLEIKYPNLEQVNELFKKIVGCPAPSEIIQGKNITGAHVQEIFSTAFLLSARNGGKIEQYVESATETVLENFYISQPKVGFQVGEDCDGPDLDKPIAETTSGDHWERKRGGN